VKVVSEKDIRAVIGLDLAALAAAQEAIVALADARCFATDSQACAKAKIVVTGTPLQIPVLALRDVAFGMHTAAAGPSTPDKRKLAGVPLPASDAVVVDCEAQSCTVNELRAMAGARRVLTPGEVLAGQMPLRRSLPDRVITSGDLTGTGAQDTATAVQTRRRLGA